MPLMVFLLMGALHLWFESNLHKLLLTYAAQSHDISPTSDGTVLMCCAGQVAVL